MIKRIILGCLLPLSAITYGDVFSEDFTKNDDYKNYISNQLYQVDNALFFKRGACADTTLKTKLSKHTVDEVKKINFTKEELKIVLIYFVEKGNYNCARELTDKGLALLNLANKLEIKGYTLKDKLYQDTKKTLTIDQEEVIKYSYLYSKIAKDKRDKLEALEELKKPFNVSVFWD